MEGHWLFCDLNGIWCGKINSTYEEELIEAKMTVNQEWLDVRLDLETLKMRGLSSGALPTYDPVTKTLSIKYFYSTFPKLAYSEENPPQLHGCARAEISMSEPMKMVITYTNERGQGGEITLAKEN